MEAVLWYFILGGFSFFLIIFIKVLINFYSVTGDANKMK